MCECRLRTRHAFLDEGAVVADAASEADCSNYWRVRIACTEQPPFGKLTGAQCLTVLQQLRPGRFKTNHPFAHQPTLGSVPSMSMKELHSSINCIIYNLERLLVCRPNMAAMLTLSTLVPNCWTHNDSIIDTDCGRPLQTMT